MKLIKSISLAALLVTAPIAFAADIAGSYTCKGTNGDGSSYEATAKLSAANDGSYNINWDLGGTKYEGVGVMNGKGDTLGGVFWGPDDKTIGVLVYQMGDDGALDGNWIMKDAGKPGNETCTKN